MWSFFCTWKLINWELFWQAIEKVKTDKTDKPYQDVKILNVTVPKSWSSWFLWPVPSTVYTGLVIGRWSFKRTVLYFFLQINLSIFKKSWGMGLHINLYFHRFCMNVGIDYILRMQCNTFIHELFLAQIPYFLYLDLCFKHICTVFFSALLVECIFVFGTIVFLGTTSVMYFWVLKDCSEKISLNTTCSVWHSCFIIKRGIINCFVVLGGVINVRDQICKPFLNCM